MEALGDCGAFFLFLPATNRSRPSLIRATLRLQEYGRIKSEEWIRQSSSLSSSKNLTRYSGPFVAAGEVDPVSPVSSSESAE